MFYHVYVYQQMRIFFFHTQVKLHFNSNRQTAKAGTARSKPFILQKDSGSNHHVTERAIETIVYKRKMRLP